ncbi:MAG TPA: exodeoxyribonuclease VII large subunit [Gemmatimonadales bacterium]
MTRRRSTAGSGADELALDLFGAEAEPASGASAPAPAPDRPTRSRARSTSRSATRARSPEPAPSFDSAVAESHYTGWDGAVSDIPGSSSASAVAISTLTATAKDVMEGAFMPLWVRGEISDFKRHRNGHWYFCLRDHASQIRCVVWSRDQRSIPAAPDDGMQVTALGQVTVYAARGDLQLTIRAMEAAGDGLWRKALDQARAALEADGLLAPERRRPLPRYPRRVAIVTSPSGAALHDIVAVARRRWPSVELVVIPAKVQGEGAPEELCAAIERVGRWGRADVVIVGRGGGAREDLWAFNDERVARAVAACPIPTISAVGHEVDVTLCDLVADHRAPTPSAAAEAAVPVLTDAAALVGRLGALLHDSMRYRLALAAEERRLLGEQLAARAARIVERRQARVRELAGRLNALSPLSTLARGYAVARDDDGRTLGAVADFASGIAFSLLLADGRVRAVTEEIDPTPPGASASIPAPEPRS